MTEQPDAESVNSKRDAVLWMWKAHNQVQHSQHLMRAVWCVLVQACAPCNTVKSFVNAALELAFANVTLKTAHHKVCQYDASSPYIMLIS